MRIVLVLVLVLDLAGFDYDYDDEHDALRGEGRVTPLIFLRAELGLLPAGNGDNVAGA